MLTQNPAAIYQLAYVVENLSEAMNHWLNQTSCGPFFLFEHFEFVEPVYRGKPGDVDISIALGYTGGLCIELIQQNDDRPSVYQEEINRKGYGQHHIAVLEPQVGERISHYESEGSPCLFRGAFSMGIQVAYLDTRATLGCMLELVEDNDVTRAILNDLQQAHADWDGRDPIRLVP
jgi:hypothetical protein